MSLRRPSPAPAPEACPAAAEGYVLPIALMIAMAVIVSAVSLAGRGLGGLAGSAVSNSGNEARDAAEAGIDLIISRLNQPINRQLMLAAVPMGQWGSSDAAIAAQLENPCRPTDTRGIKITAADFGINGSPVALPGSGNRQFRLLRLTVRGPEGSGASYSSSGSSGSLSGGYTPRSINLASRSNTGQLELEVEGSLKGTSSKVQLRRTFELVPKQCGRSFGRSADDIAEPIPPAGLWSHGNDFRYSNTFPGLVLGLAGGGLSGSSSNVSLRRLLPTGNISNNDTPLSVLCRVASSADSCGNASGGISGVPVRLAPDLPAINNPKYTEVPGWTSTPTCSSGTACLKGSPTKDRIFISISGISSSGICLQGSPYDPTNCRSADTDLTSACKTTGSGSTLAYHCAVDDLPSLITIDTSRAPIYLYYGPWSSSSSPTPPLEIRHVYCPGSAISVCSDPATGGNIMRAGVISAYPLSTSSPFNLIPSSTGIGGCINISGSGGIRDLLLWLPTGNLTMSGSSCFRGVAYVNNLSLGGNANLVIADPLRLDDGLAWLGSTLSDSISSEKDFNTDLRRIGMALYDVVARRSIGTGLVKQ